MPKKLAYEIVKKHIDIWDPIGLLDFGVPNDEYDIEVMMVVERLSVVMNVKQLSKVIQTVFNEMFYDGEMTLMTEDSEEVATFIWEDIVSLEKKAETGRFKSGARKKSKT